MFNPPHPGELVRDCIEGWDCPLSRAKAEFGTLGDEFMDLVEGRRGISPQMASMLQSKGWSTADHWLRVQSFHDFHRVKGAEEMRTANEKCLEDLVRKFNRHMLELKGPYWLDNSALFDAEDARVLKMLGPAPSGHLDDHPLL